MSYQVLARKWRPRNFASLIGQEHVVRALNHALTEQRLHHAYLFTGTRGVGKTTIARILAKSLNCESGITPLPCGACSACQEIDSGRFVDLLEVDAATNTRVEEMRVLLENAQYAPTRGRFKVYVIDEVHMLSNSAFNAMLKTLEEPPQHVKFILATTDPQKIPVTVLSRCLQFNLKQMVPTAIADYMAHILDIEEVPYEASALTLIANGAAGSMRDGLSLLDQAIAHGAGKVELVQVRQMLGAIDSGVILGLLESLVNSDIVSLLSGIDVLEAESVSFSAALRDLGDYLTRIQILQFLLQDQAEKSDQELRLMALAKAFSLESVQLAYQIVVQGRQELQLAPDEKSGFVMVMLRLHAFVQVQGIVQQDLYSCRETTQMREPLAAVEFVDRLQEIPASTKSPVVSAIANASLAGAPAVNAPKGSEECGVYSWTELCQQLDITGMAKTLALHCELRMLDSQNCLLRLSPVHKHLLLKPAQEKIQKALFSKFGDRISLKIELDEPETETPALLLQNEVAEKASGAINAIEQDGFVKEVVNLLEAEVPSVSIKSV